MTNRTMIRAGTACLTLAAALVAAPAFAQDSAAGTEEDDGAIVVTAQRREERLIDVPVSIAAIGEDRITATGARDVGDLGSYVPNVVIAEGTGLGSAVVIRGVGASSRNIGFDSRVGVYLDGVYLGQSPAINQSLVDIERVEVLRGPQGALFGKNTVAGAINLVTAKPGDDFSAYANVRYGNYDAWSLTGRVNVPIAEGVAVKLSGSRNKRDGFIHNIVDDSYGDTVDTWTWRGQLRIDATPNLQFLISGDGLIGRENGSLGNVLTNSTGTTIDTVAPGRREISVSKIQLNDRTLWGTSLDAVLSLDSGHTLKSQTSYRDTKFHTALDPDYSAFDIFYVDYHDRYKQFIEEVQFVSPSGQPFEYLAGLYYYRTNAKTDRLARTGTQGFLLFGSPNNTVLPSAGTVRTENIALYANLTYDILPNLELGAGFRLSRETKKATFDINGSTLPVLGIATGSFADKRKDEDFSPSVTLTYKLSPEISAYARYAEGYKSGGYNLDFVSAASFPNGIEFDKETVKNYELGLKGSVEGGRLTFALAGFIANYSDFQINQFRDLGGGRTAIVIGNAATVKTKGVEFEMTTRPVRGLTLAGGIGFLKADYDNLPLDPVTIVSGKLPNAPDAQASGSIEYETAVGGSLQLRSNFTYTYRGNYFSSLDNRRQVTVGSPAGPVTIPYDRVKGFGYADARIALGAENGRWEAAVFARNLFNNTFVEGYERDFFGTLIEGLGDPRTYSVEATFRF
ncbi:TonB-dependent receptor [Sphingopyxis chilensis]|uniref:TonB-dependent receptor n=1 Tax=Sphingopyxis chilensis TaxID=180400 RepID=UPI002DDD9818|nr:TonB-dependent receptor [Sphingopyxis chilensis]